MQKKDIEKHLDSYQDSDNEEVKQVHKAKNTEDDQEDNGPEDNIKKLPVCARALVKDVIHFDLSCLDFLHKLGEGKSNYHRLSG